MGGSQAVPGRPARALAAMCPELQFTVDRARLSGFVGEQWCWQLSGSKASGWLSPAFDAAESAACAAHYVDPVERPPDPSAYPGDCSYGCKPCVYREKITSEGTS